MLSVYISKFLVELQIAFTCRQILPFQMRAQEGLCFVFTPSRVYDLRGLYCVCVICVNVLWVCHVVLLCHVIWLCHVMLLYRVALGCHNVLLSLVILLGLHHVAVIHVCCCLEGIKGTFAWNISSRIFLYSNHINLVLVFDTLLGKFGEVSAASPRL
jgi:hypothetical protein